MKKVSALLLALLLVFMAGQAFAASKNGVRIVYVEWPCAVVTTNLVKVALEERLGVHCEILPVTAPVKYQSLATGHADATVCAWLPNTQKNLYAKIKDRVEDLGPLVGGAKLGWVTPDYVPYTSLEELKGRAGEFGGKIYGIEPGAEYMDNSRKAIAGYGLEDYELMEIGDAMMIKMLADSIQKKKPVVVTGWAPHWKFGRWKLHFLDDPQGYFGEEEEIHTLVRAGFKKDMPEVYAFLNKFYFTDTQQLQTLMAENEMERDPVKVARRFIQEHPEQVANWFK